MALLVFDWLSDCFSENQTSKLVFLRNKTSDSEQSGLKHEWWSKPWRYLKHVYIPRAPMTLYFWRSTPLNKAISNQNKGPRLGSRYVIGIYTYVFCIMEASPPSHSSSKCNFRFQFSNEFIRFLQSSSGSLFCLGAQKSEIEIPLAKNLYPRVNNPFKNGSSVWKMINPYKNKGGSETCLKKWWLDFQGI